MRFLSCVHTLVRRSVLVAVLSLTACDLLTAPSVATTIMLSPSEVTFDGLGDDLRVNATVKDQHGNVMSNDTITWTASDRGIATVSSSGLVTAVGPGTSTVTASAGSASGTAAVTVTQTPTSLELSDTVIHFYSVGDTTRVIACLLYTSPSPRDS